MRTIHAGTGPVAVAVDGAAIAAVGPLEELTAAYPAARVRRWAGALGPGRVASGGARALLEQTYHPDPRDADRPRDRAESVRRGIHGLLSHGVTAVVDDLTDASVRAAVDRSGMARLPEGAEPAALAVGARADLAVFNGEECLATVLAGRLVHRRA